MSRIVYSVYMGPEKYSQKVEDEAEIPATVNPYDPHFSLTAWNEYLAHPMPAGVDGTNISYREPPETDYYLEVPSHFDLPSADREEITGGIEEEEERLDFVRQKLPYLGPTKFYPRGYGGLGEGYATELERFLVRGALENTDLSEMGAEFVGKSQHLSPDEGHMQTDTFYYRGKAKVITYDEDKRLALVGYNGLRFSYDDTGKPLNWIGVRKFEDLWPFWMSPEDLRHLRELLRQGELIYNPQLEGRGNNVGDAYIKSLPAAGNLEIPGMTAFDLRAFWRLTELGGFQEDFFHLVHALSKRREKDLTSSNNQEAAVQKIFDEANSIREERARPRPDGSYNIYEIKEKTIIDNKQRLKECLARDPHSAYRAAVYNKDGGFGQLILMLEQISSAPNIEAANRALKSIQTQEEKRKTWMQLNQRERLEELSEIGNAKLIYADKLQGGSYDPIYPEDVDDDEFTEWLKNLDHNPLYDRSREDMLSEIVNHPTVATQIHLSME